MQHFETDWLGAVLVVDLTFRFPFHGIMVLTTEDWTWHGSPS